MQGNSQAQRTMAAKEVVEMKNMEESIGVEDSEEFDESALEGLDSMSE